MITLRILTRNITPQIVTSTQHLHSSKVSFSADSSDSDSSDDEKNKRKIVASNSVAKKEPRVDRLNALLQTMTMNAKTPSKVDIAVKPKKISNARSQLSKKNEKTVVNLFEKKLTGAAKDVAATFGGDTSKTESELLKKILTPSKSSEEPMDLSKLVKGMNIDRRKPQEYQSNSRADQVHDIIQKTKQNAPIQQQMSRPKFSGQSRKKIHINARVTVDSGNPLGIFEVDPEAVVDPNIPTLQTWDHLEKRDLKLLVTHPPIHFIDQMIQWTEQGKLWRFPIDNEQDLTIDQEEHFSDHVFLEPYLEGWCPRKGPIRHFMELVCVGLSKNAFMTAQEKKDHIMWFKEYFDKKRDLLTELGAYGTEKSSEELKQVEA
ncbi:28S ribosomal protein S31, mitochondrial [Neodiprion virginianus]|uniref:28S ribosomal protein S31, mitochondrial n=1 Tax=Neodiprion virginianus TaxID=2961670 RepID=UPI001EE71F5F|nr:28S ribosomal protein S31, mitochondrial [Neodiprion virginianus]